MRKTLKIKLIVAFCLFLLCTGSISAQSDNVNYNKSENIQSETVFETVDENPAFPGGFPALQAFLMENLKYPRKAQKKSIEGRVMVSFVVGKDGKITDVKNRNNVHPLLDAEAVRVVKLMPKWTPGIKNGRAVRVRYTLPITFRLRTEN